MNTIPTFHVDADKLQEALASGTLRQYVQWTGISMWCCPVDAEILPIIDSPGRFRVMGTTDREHLFDLVAPIPLGPVALGIRLRTGRVHIGGPAVYRGTCVDVEAKRVRIQSPERPVPFEPARWVWIYRIEGLTQHQGLVVFP